MPKTLMELDPSKGLLRLALRFPIILYRLRLGFLLGNRILMLTTIGRYSGKLRRAALEVVYHNRQTSEYVIASGWRKKSDWYRNLKVNPKVIVDSSNRRYQMTATQLPTEDAEKILLIYAGRYPLAFRELSKVLSDEQNKTVEEKCHSMAQNIPLIILQPDLQTSNK
jgi:deazaflavin-dependent oxidoreductase (nitroreductase family)